MPMINIQGTDYSYDEHDVINFNEGLIGFPEMHRAVVIPLADYDPFCWLAALDDDKARFIVVNPAVIFAGYRPDQETVDESGRQVFSLVKISSDWRRTTVNLRAPILIDSGTRCAAQVILDKSDYGFAEALPNN